MMKISILVILFSFSVSFLLNAQDITFVETKNSRMLNIDKIVNSINKDTTLVQYKVNERFTSSEIDNSPFPKIELSTGRKIMPTLYYMRNTTVIKVNYDGILYYFKDENLIMSKYKCGGEPHPLPKNPSEMRQWVPGHVDYYSYYRKNSYYKSFKEVHGGICSYGLTGFEHPETDKENIDSLIQKIKKFSQNADN